MSRILLAMTTLGLAFGSDVDRKNWASGEIVAALRVDKVYVYRILASRDRYTGRSTKELHVKVGDHVKFATAGKKIYMIDDEGKTQQLQFTVQEMMPAPLPAIP